MQDLSSLFLFFSSFDSHLLFFALQSSLVAFNHFERLPRFSYLCRRRRVSFVCCFFSGSCLVLQLESNITLSCIIMQSCIKRSGEGDTQRLHEEKTLRLHSGKETGNDLHSSLSLTRLFFPYPLYCFACPRLTREMLLYSYLTLCYSETNRHTYRQPLKFNSSFHLRRQAF